MIAYPAQGVTYVLFTSTRATYWVLVAQNGPGTRFADGTARVYMMLFVACIPELFIVIVVGFAVIVELSYCKTLESIVTVHVAKGPYSQIQSRDRMSGFLLVGIECRKYHQVTLLCRRNATS